MLGYMSLQVHYWVPRGNLYSPLGMAVGPKPKPDTEEDSLQPSPHPPPCHTDRQYYREGTVSGDPPSNHTSSKILVLGLVILALLRECLMLIKSQA